MNNYTCADTLNKEQVCKNGKLIRFTKDRKAVINHFDNYGRLLSTTNRRKGILYADAWEYNTDGSVNRVVFSSSGRPAFLYNYRYDGKKLLKIEHSDFFTNNAVKEISFDYYECGLVKERKGAFLNAENYFRCSFSYYAKGVKLN